MTNIVCSLSVVPLYAKVVFQATGTTDLPEWVTGEEPAVATRSAVYVATAPDTDGMVDVQVAIGNSPGSWGKEVFVTELDRTSTEIEVGSPLSGMVQKISSGIPATFTLRVYCDPVSEARRVTFFVEIPASP